MSNSDSFDPYRKWLGIPEKHQPPNHYRLLGIELFEPDPDVIESAANARMTHLRTLQTGKRAEHSQKLLNEISAAKICLLDPDKRKAYDAGLRKELLKKKKQKEAKAAAEPNDETAAASPIQVTGAKRPVSAVVRSRRRRKSTLPLVISAMCFVALVIVVIIILNQPKKPASETDTAGATQTNKPQPAATGTQRSSSNDKDRTTIPELPPPTAKDFNKDPPTDPGDETPMPSARRNIVDATTDEVDLLPVVDALQDAVRGQWVRDLSTSNLTGREQAVLQIPCKLPPYYEVTTTLKRSRGDGSFAMLMVAGEQRVAIVLDRSTIMGTASGIEAVDDQFLEPQDAPEEMLFEPNVAHTVVCAVLDDRILVRCDGEAIMDWSGAFERLSLPIRFQVGDSDQLALAVDKAYFEISQLMVRPIDNPDSYPQTGDDAPAVVEQVPVPDEEAVEEARETVRATYNLSAVESRVPSQAQKMFEDAQATNDPTMRYALLLETEQLAAEVGDAELAIKTAQFRADKFFIDVLVALRDKVDLVLQAAQSERYEQFSTTKVVVAKAAVAVAEEALEHGEIQAAIDLLSAAVDPNIRDPIVKKATDMLETLRAMSSQP